MKIIVEKEYDVNEGVFIIANVLESLYKNYMNVIPKELKSKILELIKETNNILDGNEEMIDDFDITSQKYILRTTYTAIRNNINNKY